MWDLIILEIIITLLLLVVLFRPYIRGFWPIDGIVFLPLFCLIMCLGIFAAYGFRPECIPLLFFNAVLCICHIPAAFSLMRQLKNDSFKDRNIIITLVGIIFLAGSMWAAFRFLPAVPDDISMEGITQVSLKDDSGEYFLRIYNPPEQQAAEKQPIILFVPPVAGPVSSPDRMCRNLAADGFVVLTFSRKGLDAPAVGPGGSRGYSSIFRYMRIFWTYGRGFESVWANSSAISLEEERVRDIRFLLSYIRQNAGKSGSPLVLGDPGTIIAVGHFMGGAAITQLASEPGFKQAFPEVIGFVGIESPLASSVVLEEVPVYHTDDGDTALWAGLLVKWKNFSARLKPGKIAGTEIKSFPQIPGLYIVSDKISDVSFRDNRYASIVKLLHGSGAPAMLAAVLGAGLLDYAGMSSIYPVMNVLFGETDSYEPPDFYPDTAAALIINFSSMAMVMRNSGAYVYWDDPSILIRENIPGDIYLETGGTWNLMDTGYILDP